MAHHYHLHHLQKLQKHCSSFSTQFTSIIVTISLFQRLSSWQLSFIAFSSAQAGVLPCDSSLIKERIGIQIITIFNE